MNLKDLIKTMKPQTKLKILENRLRKKKKKQLKLYEQQKVLRAEITVLLRSIEEIKR